MNGEDTVHGDTYSEDPPQGPGPHDIAVIGMAGRFPGAPGIEQFWRNLAGGVESITVFTDEELRAAGADPALLADPHHVPARGAIADPAGFDAALFDITPREAATLDPQHRVFLECAWAALDHAGCDPARFTGPIGVFGGAGGNSYLRAVGPAADQVDPFQLAIGNEKDYLTTRVSYKLGLHGPSVAVQTACSSSLVAVHLAAESLLTGECDLALAGGVSLHFPEVSGYRYEEGGITSPDGHCRPFEASARGTVPGEGAGIVVLKRLEDAIADHDDIHAVIKGSAINNDGHAKLGYTAPSEAGQAEVIAAALRVADCKPESIGYLEAHGTATPLGDPVEVAALSRVFGGSGKHCALGSVKSNIGHLDAAAGVTGLIKTVLALKHGMIPATLHHQRANPDLDLGSTPFFVATELSPWPALGGPNRAGVSSFGIGGTNAHVVLEEAPPAPAPAPPASGQWQVLPLSARAEPALRAMAAGLADHLERHPELDLAAVAGTLQLGRQRLEHRDAVAARDTATAVAALRERAARPARPAPGTLDVTFMFPGQGVQRPGMAGDLYRGEAVFRTELDRCADLLQPVLGRDLRPAVLGGSDQDGSALNDTALAQPALFAVEYALAKTWAAYGIRPAAMIGHSLGEYVAACLAGVFGLEQALRLVALRGRLMSATPPGGMLSVPLAAAEVRPLLDGLPVAVAAINAPELTVVSGESGALARVAAALGATGVTTRALHVGYGFHSPLMDDILTEYGDALRGQRLHAPTVPFLSNRTGTWITAAEATDPGYWVAHLRHTVRFSDGVAVLLSRPGRLLLEVGPGRTLTTLVSQHPAAGSATLVSSLSPGHGGETFAGALAALWTAGADLEWAARGDRPPRKVPLPAYPFQRTRHWLGAGAGAPPTAPAPAAAAPAPRSAGRTVTGIWEELLGIPHIAPDEDLFALGGDSWLAVQIISRIRAELGVVIELRDFFADPTIAGVATVVAGRQREA